MTHEDRIQVDHPLFRYAWLGPWNECPPGLTEPCVLVFERSHFITPTETQLADFRRRKGMVESLGGRMNQMEWEIGGVDRALSGEDVNGILEVVRVALPKARIVSHWNGAGCYCMSVGVDLLTQMEP